MSNHAAAAGFFEPLPALEPVPAISRQHIIVIGAGVVGLSCALWLQRAGHRVSVCDPQPPLPGVSYESSCSFGNACTVAYASCIPVATPGIVRGVPHMLLSRTSPLSIFWRDLPQLAPWLLSFLRSSRPGELRRIVAVLGRLLRLADAGHAPLIADARLEHLVRRGGCMYLYSTEDKFKAARQDIALREEQGVRLQVLDARAVREREPGLAPRYAKGVVFQDVYSLDTPHRYMLGLARLFQDRGGVFIQASAQDIVRQDGALFISTAGGPHEADTVVVSAGAWSRRLARGLGDRVRLDAERGYHVMFPGSQSLLSAPACYPEYGFYMTPLSEGLRAAGTVELGGLGQPMRPVRTQAIERVARQLLPGLGERGGEWLGFRPSMPDSLPVIGRSPRDPRVVYAFGHGHIGLTLGGITGRLVADLVGGRQPVLDLHPFRPDRFGGS